MGSAGGLRRRYTSVSRANGTGGKTPGVTSFPAYRYARIFSFGRNFTELATFMPHPPVNLVVTLNRWDSLIIEICTGEMCAFETCVPAAYALPPLRPFCS